MPVMERLRSWLWPCLLYAPVLLVYAAHFAPAVLQDDVIPTGFIQMDQAYYMANAREYQDGGTNGILYSQPFSAHYDAQPIYFQPHLWLLGQLWRILPVDPGLLFVLFGVVFGLLCIRTCLSVLRAFVPSGGKGFWIVEVLFIWGGGLLFLIGFLLNLSRGVALPLALMSAFRLDPANGWWFLNLGRNLVYPLEAYYHFLFFAALLSMVRARYRTAVVLIALLAISHPFTGTAACLVFIGWALLERAVLRNAQVPWSFITALLMTLLACVFYYGVWMPHNTEHAQLMEQWKLPWLLEFESFAPAYALVALLAVARLRNPALFKGFLSVPTQRFLLVWALVIFGLENHELLVEPHQPVHFSRGYVWSALFLIGAPWLAERVRAVMQRTDAAKWLVVATVTGLFCLDNAAWFTRSAFYQATAQKSGMWLTRNQQDILQHLDHDYDGPKLLVSQSTKLGYLAAVYTPYRPYVGHKYNTPDVARKMKALDEFFDGRSTDPLLDGALVVLAERSKSIHLPRPMELIYENKGYAIYRSTTP